MLLHLPHHASPFDTSCCSYACHLMLPHLPRILLHFPPHAPTLVTSCSYTKCSHTCHVELIHLPPHAPLATSCSGCPFLKMHDFLFLPKNRWRGSTIFILPHAQLPIVIIISILVERVFINTTYWHQHTTIISSRFQVISQIIRALFSFTIRNIEVHLGLMSCFDDLSNLYIRFVQLSSIWISDSASSPFLSPNIRLIILQTHLFSRVYNHTSSMCHSLLYH